MKIPTFAALCLLATMSLGSAAAGEKDEDGKGKEDGAGKQHAGLAALFCKPVVCAKGEASRAKIVAAVEKAIPKLPADSKEPQDCVKQLLTKKDKLKDILKTVGPDLKDYHAACKAELKAAHEARKDARDEKKDSAKGKKE